MPRIGAVDLLEHAELVWLESFGELTQRTAFDAVLDRLRVGLIDEGRRDGFGARGDTEQCNKSDNDGGEAHGLRHSNRYANGRAGESGRIRQLHTTARVKTTGRARTNYSEPCCKCASQATNTTPPVALPASAGTKNPAR